MFVEVVGDGFEVCGDAMTDGDGTKILTSRASI